MLDLILVGVWVLIQQLGRHQDKTRRAIPALKRAGLYEGFLHRTELVPIRETLDRPHFGAIEEGCKIEAARYGRTVHEHRAAPAHALPAALACARQVEIALQYLDDVMI